MYFKRKIDAKLDEWIRKKDSSPALVVGVRQFGVVTSTEPMTRLITRPFDCTIDHPNDHPIRPSYPVDSMLERRSAEVVMPSFRLFSILFSLHFHPFFNVVSH